MKICIAAILATLFGFILGFRVGAVADPVLTLYNHAKPGEKFLVLRLHPPSPEPYRY